MRRSGDLVFFPPHPQKAEGFYRAGFALAEGICAILSSFPWRGRLGGWLQKLHHMSCRGGTWPSQFAMDHFFFVTKPVHLTPDHCTDLMVLSLDKFRL